MAEESPEALVEPALLVWARERARISTAEAARRIDVSETTLLQWEQGLRRPTMKQARKLAGAYRQPLPVFFLERVPDVPRVFVPDRRTLPHTAEGSGRLWVDVERSVDRRAVVVELLGEALPSPFELTASVSDDPEAVGARLRKHLGVTVGDTHPSTDPRVTMNAWRDALETRGVLVFQSNAFALEDARAYSVWFDVLPLVVVHRGDAYAGRSFSLLHEAAHLTLRSDGVCEVTEGGSPGSVEVFCNAVAGAALAPRRLLRKITGGRLGPEWTDQDLAGFAAHFGVSRQVLLRRLHTLGLTDSDFFDRKHRELLADVGPRRTGGGGPTPVVDVLSRLGRPFARGVLGALDRGAITDIDASSYLDLKQKHFEELRTAAAG